MRDNICIARGVRRLGAAHAEWCVAPHPASAASSSPTFSGRTSRLQPRRRRCACRACWGCRLIHRTASVCPVPRPVRAVQVFSKELHGHYFDDLRTLLRLLPATTPLMFAVLACPPSRWRACRSWPRSPEEQWTRASACAMPYSRARCSGSGIPFFTKSHRRPQVSRTEVKRPGLEGAAKRAAAGPMRTESMRTGRGTYYDSYYTPQSGACANVP